jgi:hypothetical protein
LAVAQGKGPGPAPLARALGAGRIAIGAGIWLAPALAGRVLGVGALAGGALAIARVAATRDLILGTAQIATAGERAAARNVAVAGTVADAADALAFALAFGAGERSAGLRGLAAAVPATALGAWLSAQFST